MNPRGLSSKEMETWLAHLKVCAVFYNRANSEQKQAMHDAVDRMTA